ncbi:MAG TPA: hypothetical protein VE093_21160 [Polyangiaceae bacterium]|jgi:hypothetical protein|nr:hypothetical protein [Polyangiaceae bacterium]
MTLSYSLYTGPLTNDLTPLNGKLFDFTAGSMRGLRPDLPHFATVTLELAQSYPTAGENAGIPQDVYDHFVMCNATVEIIDEKIAIARKQLEVLEESRAFYVDARQNDIALMVDAMRSRARRRKDSSILSPFETVIAYNGQIGDKATKTRKKNAAKADEQNQDGVERVASP